jgi:hypothetical protein
MPYPKPPPPKFKLQVQDDANDPRSWHDVRSPEGQLYVFEDEGEARAKLAELFPILYKLEQFAAGPKRTRVIAILVDEDDERR